MLSLKQDVASKLRQSGDLAGAERVRREVRRPSPQERDTGYALDATQWPAAFKPYQTSAPTEGIDSI